MDKGAAAHPGADRDAEWQGIFNRELGLLRTRAASSLPKTPGNGSAGRNYLIGLCLSGGGIRSATVSLGILQTLAGRNLLRHVDYLSSVSGGGYTGSGLALHYAQLDDRNADPDLEFPFSAEHDVLPDPPAHGDERAEERRRSQAARLAYLRNHANYLSHTGLADLATGFFVVARALLMNMFVWITLGGTLLALLMAVFQWWSGFSDDSCLVYTKQCWGNQFFDFLLSSAAVFGTVLGALSVGFSLSSWQLRTMPYPAARSRQQQMVLLAAGLAAAAVALLLLNSLPAVGGNPRLGANLLPIFGLTLAALVALGCAALLVGTPLRDHGNAALARKYARRYAQESFCGAALIAIAGLLLIGSLPVIRDLLGHFKPLEGIAGASGSGPLATTVYLVALGSALYGYYRGNLQGTLGLGSAFLVVAGSAFLCFGALLLAYEVAAGQIRLINRGEISTLGDALTVAAPLVALALCLCVNINDISLGRFYRDRLMETFMPDAERVTRDEIGPAAGADRFRLSQLVAPLKAPVPAEGPLMQRCLEQVRGPKFEPDAERASLVGPYPIINTNLMTHVIGDATGRRRGGDSFVLTPLSCGSTTTGWRPTSEVIGGRLTLATAMATSGAAANPRGGFGGTGPTTNAAVVLAMSLLSIRLGYWLRWRDEDGLLGWLNPHGNHLRPGALDLVTRRPGAFLELTDGGHFENLGLYELVRRRCGLIIVCDGGDDRTASYANFTVAARRIEEDFGATFSFDFEIGNGSGFERSGPQHVVARSAANEYPKDAEYARRGYFLASIRYGQGKPRVPMAPDGPDTGIVIYLKSAMIPSLSLTSRSYKGANADFPYESTADQFFSAEQFEAYRDVGVRIASQMLEETDLVHLFADGERPSLAALRSTHGFAGPASWRPWHNGRSEERPPPH